MTNEIENKLSENVHYEIVPNPEDNLGWAIRILEEFPETVIQIGSITYDGTDEDDEEGYLSFNFSILSTPDPDLTVDDLTLQEYCSRILSTVIEMSLIEGSFVAKDNKTGEIISTDEAKQYLEDHFDEQ